MGLFNGDLIRTKYLMFETFKILVEYFSQKSNPYKILYYKDIPISHCRLHRPYYIKPEDDIIIQCKELGREATFSLLDNIFVIAKKYNLFTEQKYFEREIAELNLNLIETKICNNVIIWIQIQIFATTLNEFEKFNYPVIANENSTGLLDIHPGRTRLRTLEYLYLKNKKEYYIDVILYKNKNTAPNINEGFLIDKTYKVINTVAEFIDIYGYKTFSDFRNDLNNIKVITKVPVGKVWITKTVQINTDEILLKIIEFKELLKIKFG